MKVNVRVGECLCCTSFVPGKFYPIRSILYKV